MKCMRSLSLVACLLSSYSFGANPTWASAETFRTVALVGNFPLGTPRVLADSGSLSGPLLNSVGQTAFSAGEVATSRSILWREVSDSLQMIARGGDPAPGTPSGVNFPNQIGVGAFNSVGQSVFATNLAGSGVDNTNFQGIFFDDSGSLRLIARAGDPAANTPSGVNYGLLGGIVPLNNAGQIAFKAGLTGSGVDATNDVGIWSEGSGALALVARSGDPAPDTPSGVVFDRMSGFSRPILNSVGQTALIGTLTGTGIDGLNAVGIWSERTGALSLVARTGDPAPGTPDGVNFADLRLAGFNSAGQAAFQAVLIGAGIDNTNNSGIWAQDDAGILQLIIRGGDELEVAPGVFRTVSFASMLGVNLDEEIDPGGFNDLGQIAFQAFFTDNSRGSFVSNRVAVPEPGTLMFVTAGLVVLSTRRQRYFSKP